MTNIEITILFLEFFSSVLIISCFYVIFVIIKGWKKEEIDIPLRVTAIQLAIITIICHISIFLYSTDLQSKYCTVYIIFRNLTSTIIPLLVTSYFFILRTIMFGKNYFKTNPCLSYFIMLLINWVLPVLFWLIYFVFNNFPKESEKCIMNEFLIRLFAEILIFGITILGFYQVILIIKNYHGIRMTFETDQQILWYTSVIIGFMLFSFMKIIFYIMEIDDKHISEQYQSAIFVYNFFYGLFPCLFFYAFCFQEKTNKREIEFESESDNPFDSITT